MGWIDYIQKDLPQHLDWWPYTLGAIPLTLFGLLVGDRPAADVLLRAVTGEGL